MADFAHPKTDAEAFSEAQVLIKSWTGSQALQEEASATLSNMSHKERQLMYDAFKSTTSKLGLERPDYTFDSDGNVASLKLVIFSDSISHELNLKPAGDAKTGHSDEDYFSREYNGVKPWTYQNFNQTCKTLPEHWNIVEGVFAGAVNLLGGTLEASMGGALYLTFKKDMDYKNQMLSAMQDGVMTVTHDVPAYIYCGLKP
jgi:hypothetical protein